LTRATGYDNCTIFNVNATGHIYIKFLSVRRHRAREDPRGLPGRQRIQIERRAKRIGDASHPGMTIPSGVSRFTTSGSPVCPRADTGFEASAETVGEHCRGHEIRNEAAA
jgi:hypothetical protein